MKIISINNGKILHLKQTMLTLKRVKEIFPFMDEWKWFDFDNLPEKLYSPSKKIYRSIFKK